MSFKQDNRQVSEYLITIGKINSDLFKWMQLGKRMTEKERKLFISRIENATKLLGHRYERKSELI